MLNSVAMQVYGSEACLFGCVVLTSEQTKQFIYHIRLPSTIVTWTCTAAALMQQRDHDNVKPLISQ